MTLPGTSSQRSQPWLTHPNDYINFFREMLDYGNSSTRKALRVEDRNGEALCCAVLCCAVWGIFWILKYACGSEKHEKKSPRLGREDC